MQILTNSLRTPWTAAVLLLVLIWTVFLLHPKVGVPSLSEVGKSPEPINVAPAAVANPPEPDIEPIADAKGSTAEESTTTGEVDSKTTSPEHNETAQTSSADRPLVLYVYSETENARSNLKFFLAHGIHDNADFVFIMNGDTDAPALLPTKSNIRFIRRPNDCYDLGAHAEVLLKDDLWKSYTRFILMNASIRGPFMPSWAGGCWSEAYLSKVTEEVKIVGMTGNCQPNFHVQSMIWATDSVGLRLLLHPPPPKDPSAAQEVGINGCFHTWAEAVHAETSATQIILDAGYKASVMMTAFHSDVNFIDHCDTGGNGDVLWNGFYYGANVHPYETIFMKSNRDIDPVLMDRLTEWTDKSGYSSYDHC